MRPVVAASLLVLVAGAALPAQAGPGYRGHARRVSPPAGPDGAASSPARKAAHAAQPAQRLRRREGATRDLPEYVQVAARASGLAITSGFPRATWNGLSPDPTEVGQKGGGSRSVHLLPPGLHPTSVAEARVRLAWSPGRARLFAELERAVPRLRELGVTHIAIGGSFGSTDFEAPGDVDIVAFVDRARAGYPRGSEPSTFSHFNRTSGDGGIQAHAHDESIFFPGGPGALSGLSRAPPNPRPDRPSLGGPRGPKVGLVLIDLSEFR